VKSLNKAPARRGWVLYDDSCGFCRRWVSLWRSTLRRRGYDIAPLQSAWVRERLHLSSDELLDDLRLLRVDGTQVQGADVYRQIMREIWWAYPLCLLASAPVLRSVFDLGYRAFATNRFRISRSCSLSSHTHLSKSHDAGCDLP
jgi:predicted DCC family thiol-disulfide oxidoreductase YuxK